MQTTFLAMCSAVLTIKLHIHNWVLIFTATAALVVYTAVQ